MISLKPETRLWIESNMKSDLMRLRLKHHGDSEMEFAIMQIDCRRKTAKKLFDTLKCNDFIFPTYLSAEQCTSDILADYHSSLITPGESILDMTCGLGIDAFHLARKAASVIAIDLDSSVSEAAIHNAKAQNLSNITVENCDSSDFIRNTPLSFDTIFIDPARRGGHGQKLVALADCSPNVAELLHTMQQKSKRIIIKASPMLDIRMALKELNKATAIQVIGTPTECKELMIVIDEAASSDPEIKSVTLTNANMWEFSFHTTQESSVELTDFALPRPGDILYEPFPSIMKSGAMKLIATKFGISKLHRHTHLYTATDMVDNFPGHKFRVLEVLPFNKKAIKEIKSRGLVTNASTRNFRLSAPELVRKLKIREGGETQLFGAKCFDDCEYLIITQREIISQTYAQ